MVYLHISLHRQQQQEFFFVVDNTFQHTFQPIFSTAPGTWLSDVLSLVGTDVCRRTKLLLCNGAPNHNKEIKLNDLDFKGNVQTQLDKNYFICKQNSNSV